MALRARILGQSLATEDVQIFQAVAEGPRVLVRQPLHADGAPRRAGACRLLCREGHAGPGQE